MKVNFEQYKANRKVIKKHIAQKGFTEDTVAMLATSTGVACIVVLYYIGEIMGFTDQIKDDMKRLAEFYQYTKFEDCGSMDEETIDYILSYKHK